MRLRSAVSILSLVAAPALAQTRAIDEGTFVVTKGGATAFTESFRITRRAGGLTTTTGPQVSGAQQTTSSLTTDTLGTPVRYELHVTEKGTRVFDVRAEARAGRLASLSSTRAGDESMREYPMRVGHSLILDERLLHQLYFVALAKRSASFQAIEPRSARTVSVNLAAKGMEPVQVAGKSLTGTHYSLTAGPVRYEYWVDSQGRLLKVEAPSEGLVATRDEAPR